MMVMVKLRLFIAACAAAAALGWAPPRQLRARPLAHLSQRRPIGPRCAVAPRPTAAVVTTRAAPEDAADEEAASLNPGLGAFYALGAAAVFGLGIYATMGPEAAMEFSAGYVVEQSLSVDNLLVFLVLFDYFKVPPGPMQEKALAYGLYGAVACRAVFVGLGAVALANFKGVLIAFSALLIFTSFKILTIGDGDDDEDVSENAIVKLVNRQTLLPSTDAYDAEDPTSFFSVGADGIARATPLLAAVVCLELSDIVFAVDSVPAVFGVTENTFLVYTSNVFAILGLRSWFSVLAKAADDLVYLDKAVAVVLGFVGVKLGASYFGFEVDTGASLAVISAVLGAGVAASLYLPPPGEEGGGDK